jgi:predicted ribosome quality control (RQC) complex YloA/Tae2 family protein
MDLALSNLTLKHLVEELKFLENGFVNNVQTLENGWIKVKVHSKASGDKNLVITQSALFVSNYSLQAKQSPGGFSALLKKYLNNQRIIKISQHSADRIIVVEFPESIMIIELFAKGNLVLCNKEMKIIKAMRREEWKDRKLEQNAEYKYPSSKGIHPLEENEKNFEAKLKENKKTLFGACVDILNTPPLILENVFSELGIDKKKNASEAITKEVNTILKKIKEIYFAPAKKPILIDGVLYTGGIGEAKTSTKEFENINSALNSLLLNEEVKETAVPLAQETKNERKNKFEKEVNAKNNQILGLGVQEKELQEKGEKIYLKYNELKELFTAINKAKEKGICEKEIVEKINSKIKLIKKLDFKKNTVIVEIN